MACAYLLTLQKEPSAPELEQSYTAKQWAKLRADDTMKVVPDDVDSDNEEAKAVTESELATTLGHHGLRLNFDRSRQAVNRGRDAESSVLACNGEKNVRIGRD